MKSNIVALTFLALPFMSWALQDEIPTDWIESKLGHHKLPFECEVLYAPLSAVKGISTEAVGVAVFQCCHFIKTMFYEIFTYDLEDSFMSHIHLLPSKKFGVWLQPTDAAAEVPCLNVVTKGEPITACPTYKPGKFSGLFAKGTITPADFAGPECFGCITPNLTFETLMANIANKQAYVNIHTKQNLGGEISGIIRAV